MFIYQVERFEKELEKDDKKQRIHALLKQIENSDRIELLTSVFKPFHSYMIRQESNKIILASSISVDNNFILCLLDIFTIGDKTYKEFIKNPKEFGEKKYKKLLKPNKIRVALSSSLKSKSFRQLKKLKKMPKNLYNWMTPLVWDEARVVIYESDEWIKRFRNYYIQRDWETYYKLLLKIVSENSNIGNNWDGSVSYQKKNYSGTHYGVLYSKIEVTEPIPKKIVYLIAPFIDKEPESHEIETILNINFPFYNLDEKRDFKLDEIARFSRRAYPDDYLGDQSIWADIEHENDSNLAFSYEEEVIIRSVASGKGGLPIFINGRAGSGKSTMLIYLFAEYCHRKITQKLELNPLFLTYSYKLVDVARNHVRDLIFSHHNFMSKAMEDKNDIYGFIHDFFKPFHNFLKNLLPDERREDFNETDENYVSFNRFKQLYQGTCIIEKDNNFVCKQIEKNNLSAELCWHVIRTFIKGYSDVDYITPEDYLILPRRDRSISDQTYKIIYDSIWNRWYKPLTEKHEYWDDQDLVREILNKKYYEISGERYSAIFCDEAQDFTRIELRLIMRLSFLSLFELSDHPPPCLPFAFAGDPFQSINPSGFRWPSIQSAFYEEILVPLDPLRQWNIDMNYKVLKFNYRSTEPIVKASNTIQLWRHVLFNELELEPQPWWHIDRGKSDKMQDSADPDPLKFIIDRTIKASEIKDHLKNTIILVPVDEGQEEFYASNDPLLSELIDDKNSGDPPKNIMSPALAKGLEFEKVVLYNFGEQSLWDLNNQSEFTIEAEFYFNKLYVGITRAVRSLYIVDSIEGDNKLWKFAETDGINSFAEKTDNPEAWKESCSEFREGTKEHVSEMEEKNLYSIAKKLYEEGLNLENPSLLRRAKQYFATLSMRDDMEICEAWALKYERILSKAGDIFVRQGLYDEGLECYWEDRNWKGILKFYTKLGKSVTIKGKNERFYKQFAEFMESNKGDYKKLRHFTSFITEKIEKNQIGSRFSPQWSQVIEEYQLRVKRKVEKAKKEISKVALEIKQSIKRYGEVLAELAELRFSIEADLIAWCFYICSEYVLSIKYWDMIGYHGKHVNISKAEIFLKEAKLGEALKCFSEANEHERVVNLGKKNKSELIQYQVAKSLFKLGDYKASARHIDVPINSAKKRKAMQKLNKYLSFQAQIYIELGRLDKAFENYKEAREYSRAIKIAKELNMSEDSVVEIQALDARNKGDFKTAISLYEKIEDSYNIHLMKAHNLKYLEKYDEAVEFFLVIEEWREVFDCIEKLLESQKSAEAQKCIIKLLKSVKEIKKIRITDEERGKIMKWVGKIREDEDWPIHIPPLDMGLVYEKFDSFVNSADFYEKFAFQEKWAQEGWIRVKNAQQDYHKKKGELNKARKIARNISKHKAKWGYEIEVITV